MGSIFKSHHRPAVSLGLASNDWFLNLKIGKVMGLRGVGRVDCGENYIR